MESLDSLATLSDDQQRRLYILFKDVKAKLRKYTKEIERKSFHIHDLEDSLKRLQSNSEEDILNYYLMSHYIQYYEWEVLEY